MEQIAGMIETEVARFVGEESLANALRCAAVFVHEAYPQATAGDFGDAAATVEGPNGQLLHRQAAMNRWNEAKHNWGDEW